jgi:hypothetical protein
MIAGREAREHRRLFQRLLSDFEKSLVAPARKLTPAEILAEIHNSSSAA